MLSITQSNGRLIMRANVFCYIEEYKGEREYIIIRASIGCVVLLAAFCWFLDQRSDYFFHENVSI